MVDLKLKDVFLFLVIAVLLGGCSKPDSLVSEELQISIVLLAMLQQAELNQIPPNQTYLERTNTGLSAWQLGIVGNQTSSGRHVGDAYHAHYPRNWISVTDESCQGLGVNGFLFQPCSLETGAIGFCETRTVDRTGEIVDSTLVILSTYQDDPLISPEEKEAVFTHEIGHCLGLTHNDNKSFLMFADSRGVNTPHQLELDAVASAYLPNVQEPPHETAREYFAYTLSGHVARQFSFPTFSISSRIGNGMLDGAKAQPQKLRAAQRQRLKISGPTTTRRHLFKRDGTCTSLTY